MPWHKLCSPIEDGGLGLRSFRAINEAIVFKLGWEFISSDSQWARFFRSRFIRQRTPISYYIQSSIWPGIKSCIQTVLANVSWQLGYGKLINFWTDTWLSQPIVNILQIPEKIYD